MTEAPIVVNGTVLLDAGQNLVLLDGATGKVLQRILLPKPSIYWGTGSVPGMAAGEGVIAVPNSDTITLLEPSGVAADAKDR